MHGRGTGCAERLALSKTSPRWSGSSFCNCPVAMTELATSNSPHIGQIMVTLAIAVRICSAIAPQMGQSMSWLAGCEGRPRPRAEISLLLGAVCFCTRCDIYTPMVGGLKGCWAMLRGVAAMPIRPFIRSGVFEPEATAVMSEAFWPGRNELNASGQPKVAPEVLAGRIIAAARLGERDPARLRAAALAGLPGE